MRRIRLSGFSNNNPKEEIVKFILLALAAVAYVVWAIGTFMPFFAASASYFVAGTVAFSAFAILGAIENNQKQS